MCLICRLRKACYHTHLQASASGKIMRPLPVMWAKQEAQELSRQEKLDFERTVQEKYTEWLAAQEALRKFREYHGLQESSSSFYDTKDGVTREPDVDEWNGEQLHYLSDIPKTDLNATFTTASDGKQLFSASQSNLKHEEVPSYARSGVASLLD